MARSRLLIGESRWISRVSANSRRRRAAKATTRSSPRDWPAGAVIATHEHPFAVKALVVAGEMWLSEGDSTRHLRPGDTFELAAGVPHAERYGAAGATYWAARRHAKR